MEIKVVTGSNYGDEGKGLVSGYLAQNARNQNKKVLTVLFNGGAQRGHTFNGKVYHCTGAGECDTYYHEKFLLDPVTLWLTQEKVYINPHCRVVLPCDIMNNRKKEIERGENKHGSCGMGIFEASKRSANKKYCIEAWELKDSFNLYYKVKRIQKEYCTTNNEDDLHNLDIWMQAVGYVLQNCKIASFSEIFKDYDIIIYEGGQGLLLDQTNGKDFPYLTPSSVGGFNIANEIAMLNVPTSIYYVSRSYITRHGRGPMEQECSRADINSNIVDTTNEENDWQEKLRFGFLNPETLFDRVKKDLSHYSNEVEANMVFTQLNYTNDKLCCGKNSFQEITKPDFIKNIFGSKEKDNIFRIT